MNVIDALANTPFNFWVCPNGCQGFVEWDYSSGEPVATCEECGATSAHIDSTGVGDEDKTRH